MPRQTTAIRNDIVALVPRLSRFVRQLCDHDDDVNAIVEEACLRALRSINQWDRGQPFDRWLFHITSNCWFGQSDGTGQWQKDLGADVAQSQDIDSGFAKPYQATEFQRFGSVEGLPPDLAAALLVVVVEGFSYDEAAKLLRIPQTTVLRRVHNARTWLRRSA
ncbi:MAG: RNA polymerase sigma factor [Pseudomonadota bacterium]